MTSLAPQFIDVHAHLDFCKPEELVAVLERMRAERVAAISAGTHSGDWTVISEIAQAHPDEVLGITAALHPIETKENWRDELAALEKFLSAGHPVVGIGECGLDFFHLRELPNARELATLQREAFAAQLSIIGASGLPAQIHSRGEGAFREILAMVDRSGVDWTKISFHCFAEGPDEIRELNARGARASFTGIITFKNGQKARDALLAQSPERLMLETDSPFLSPEPFRGQTNDSSRVGLVYKKAAALFGMEDEALRQKIQKNVAEFFGLKDALAL